MFQNLRNLLQSDSEYAELEASNVPEERGRIPIHVDSLNNFADSERLLRKCREGGVIFARIGQFKNTNIEELRRALSRMKTVATAMGGEIISIGNDWVILTPSNVTVAR